jgi:hypothetical protein
VQPQRKRMLLTMLPDFPVVPVNGEDVPVSEDDVP